MPAVFVADVAHCPIFCGGSCEEVCSEYNYLEDVNTCRCEALPIACSERVEYFMEAFSFGPVQR
jgi:hypothetical protein